MSEQITLDEFVKRVSADKDVSFVVAFTKDSVDEAYYAPGPGSQIDTLDSPVSTEAIKEALLSEKSLEMKAMTILNAHASPGWTFVHLPSCRYIKIPG